MTKKRDKTQVVELLQKINSEGIEYYFTAYFAPERLDETVTGDKFKRCAILFADAHSNLINARDELMAEYDISCEEIEV